MKCENCTKYDDCRTGSGLTWPCGAYRPKTGGGMDIEKLIEQLEAWNEQHLSVVCGNGHFACDYLCENEDCIVIRAATALSTLQAENAQLRAENNMLRRMQPVELNGESARSLSLALETSQLRSELEQVKVEREAAEARAEKAERERDAAVSDLETIMAYNSDTCQFCKNGQCYVRGGTKSCLPKWRGQKEE